MFGGPLDNPFFAAIHKEFKEAENYFPVKVEYITGKEATPSVAVDISETILAAKPDGIIAGFWLPELMDEFFRKVIEQGIPLMAYNMDDPRPEDKRIPHIGYVGMDERVTGEILAKATFEKLGSIGIDIKRVVIGIPYPESSVFKLRSNSIVKVLEERGIPSDELDVGDEAEKTTSVLSAYLNKHPETNLLCMLGGINIPAALKLIEKKKLKGKVFTCTYDVSPEIIGGIKDGDILYTISQQPFAQGFCSVECLYKYLEYGIIPPKQIATGPTLVDLINIGIIEKQIKEVGYL